MTEHDKIEAEKWRQRPWAIVLLILLAAAFGVQAVLVGITLLTVSTGAMLVGWTALLIMSLRQSGN